MNITSRRAWVVALALGCSAAGPASDDEAEDSRADSRNDSGTDVREYFDGPAEVVAPLCGNAAVDPGEECDDGNRVDGDGCDWLCRVGDGESPPEPDPSVRPLVPEGDGDHLDAVVPFGHSGPRIPLVWTGTDFVAAIVSLEDDMAWRIRLYRFDAEGMNRGEWAYRVAAPEWLTGPDLVASPDGFGLFYSNSATGIYFLRLDREGKPLGDPVVVVDGPDNRDPSAAWTGSSYALAWYDSPGRYCSGPGSAVHARLVGPDGRTSGLPGPVTIDDDASWPPILASGPDGIGLVWAHHGPGASTGCSMRFGRLTPDLTAIVESGNLQSGETGDVVWVDDGYRVTFSGYRDGTPLMWCVARFSADGEFDGPPVCNVRTGSRGFGNAPQIAGGAGGLALLGRGPDPTDNELLLLRTDMAGVAVGDPLVVVSGTYTDEPFGIAWGSSEFGVIHGMADGLDEVGFWFRRFAAAD